MARAVDVAAYIVEVSGPMSAMKLQKLAYYSKAWHLVWDDEPMFLEAIEAWANGPVVYDLFVRHKGMFDVDRGVFAEGDPSQLTDEQRGSIDAVVGFYGKYSAHDLSELTHRETPWREARVGLAPGERGNNVISDAALAEFYGGLTSAD
jgi:uncharacterized phage-associated protein